MKYTIYNEEKGYYEIVKSEFRGHNFIHYGMKLEDGTTIIPVDFYTTEEIRLAEWELCGRGRKYEVVRQIASSPNWTIVKERD